MARNKAAKGRRIEETAESILRREGYTAIHRVQRQVHRTNDGYVSNRQDLFGVADIAAKKAGHRTLYIQVTCATNIAARLHALEEVPWDDRYDDVQLWRWVGGGGKRIDGRNGQPREMLYFQIYKRELGYAYLRESRIYLRQQQASVQTADYL